MSGVSAIYALNNSVLAHMPDINGMQDASSTIKFESRIKKIQPVVRHQTPRISRSRVNEKPRAGTLTSSFPLQECGPGGLGSADISSVDITEAFCGTHTTVLKSFFFTL